MMSNEDVYPDKEMTILYQLPCFGFLRIQEGRKRPICTFKRKHKLTDVIETNNKRKNVCLT